MVQFYAEDPTVRTRQIVFDLAVVAWCAFSLWVGRKVFALVDKLGGPGRFLQDAAPGVSNRSDDAPGFLRGPVERFDDALNGIGGGLRNAGSAQVEAAHDLAVALGVVIGLLMVAVVLVRYLPSRLRWLQDVAAINRLRNAPNFERLLAQRAVVNQPLTKLARVSADPVDDVASGNHRALAQLELGALGVRVSDRKRAGTHPREQ